MTHAPTRSTHVRARRLVTGAAAIAVIALTASPALAQVEMPSRDGTVRSAAAPSAPAPVASTTDPASTVGLQTTPATRATVAITLRVGSRGSAVTALQRALRARGIRVAVDGAFGPGTRRAVIRMQRRLGLRPTGVADTKLLRKLRLKTRSVASAALGAPATKGTGYLQVFPVAGEHTYFDDFGAPRHQGSHEGTDVMADRGTPLVAVTDATVDRVQRTESGLGGLYVWLRRADGVEYYYAHMNSVAAGLTEGGTVRAGQVIGTVGNTGDARYGAPHLHFEIRVGGNTPINPYTHLVAVDGTRQVSAARTR